MGKRSKTKRKLLKQEDEGVKCGYGRSWGMEEDMIKTHCRDGDKHRRRRVKLQ